MPIYEYECKHCGQFEVLQKITEKPLKACEKCGRPVHRLVSLSSFNLVGGGWYKDLYSSTKPGNTASEGEPKPAKPVKPPKAETKTETKAETKKPAPAAA